LDTWKLATGTKRCIGQLLNIALVVRETRIGISALKVYPNVPNNAMG